MSKNALKLKKRASGIVIAAALNFVLITMLALYLASGTEQLLLAILLPSAVHISLCGTLLLLFYTDNNDSGY